jgi:hypothetical protein
MDTMTIEQAVDIPADHQLFIEVPPEVPAGRTILAFRPVPAVPEIEGADAETAPFKSAEEALERFRAIRGKFGSKLTGDMSLAWRREDRELEEAEYRRRHHREAAE